MKSAVPKSLPVTMSFVELSATIVVARERIVGGIRGDGVVAGVEQRVGDVGVVVGGVMVDRRVVRPKQPHPTHTPTAGIETEPVGRPVTAVGVELPAPHSDEVRLLDIDRAVAVLVDRAGTGRGDPRPSRVSATPIQRHVIGPPHRDTDPGGLDRGRRPLDRRGDALRPGGTVGGAAAVTGHTTAI